MERVVEIIANIGGLPALLILGVGFLLYKFLPELIKVMKGHTEVAQKIEQEMYELTQSLAELRESDLQQTKRLNSIELDNLKRSIYSDYLPYSERVWAAHKYLRLGGNGDTKSYVISSLRNDDNFNLFWKFADKNYGYVEI